jgi:secreted trypsin-like serine protease
MKIIKIVKVLTIFCFFDAVVSTDRETKIVGGINALPNEFPFLVSLQWFWVGSSAHFCAGVILSNVWILTVSFIINSSNIDNNFLFLGCTLHN